MNEKTYVTGGPLAGVELALFPTQHGEEPGHPGCIPGTRFARADQRPEHELYSGSVEHWRVCRPRSVPPRPFFDRQSQLRNWGAPNIPGARPEEIEEYAAPVYWPQDWFLEHYVAPAIPNEPGEARNRAAAESLQYSPLNTHHHLQAVPVVRCRIGRPRFELELGELDRGLYVVRVIGAVETGDVLPFRKPLFLRAVINDGINGEASVYRQRLGHCDEFYDVGDIYFHAVERRGYQMTLQVDEGSEVDLLVHNISLDDVLAGCVRRPIKTRSLRAPDRGTSSASSDDSSEERLKQDAAIWHGFPRLNFQGGRFHASGPEGIPGVEPGSDEMTREQIEERYGAWLHSPELEALLVNDTLGLKYTMADLHGHRPLPDPYPFKDDGAGLIFPSKSGPHAGRVWAPVAEALSARLGSYYRDFVTAADACAKGGDMSQAREGAMKLVRFAYSFPALEDVNMLTAVVHEPSSYGRGDRCRRRETGGGQFLGHFGFHFELAQAYDGLFPYIKGNEELARAAGRFVPWVRSPDDVIELLDVYLLQTFAKRFLRYHYWGDGRQPAYLAEVAAILGDNTVTEPWMEWLFERTFYYPRPVAGLPDYMVTACDRDGRGSIASSSYVFGAYTPAKIAETVDIYVKNGGDPKYDLCDSERFPKIIPSLYFPIRSRTAGMWTMRMGNVSGPDKDYTKSFDCLLGEHAASPWRWTHDPCFAYVLKHYGTPEEWSDQEWQEIAQAASQVRRAPWMDNRSRVLPGHAAFLESGLQHDDFRFRRSVMLRVGTGTGHSHQDTLDLQIHAHGLPATIDAGQRAGYSVPGDKLSRVHNTVEVDGQDWLACHAGNNNQRDHTGGTNSWVRTLSDQDGARYMAAEIAPNALARFARRQVALIDVDEGRGSRDLPPEAYGRVPSGLPKDVVTPNSYVFDVFRVSGGNTHTYCFHSHLVDPIAGDPQPQTNAVDIRPLLKETVETERDQIAAHYLRDFAGERWHGLAPENLEATFPLQKERVRPGQGRRFAEAGTESYLLKTLYDPEAPDKFTRLHLPGHEGALVMRGDLNCVRWDYRIPNLFVQRTGENLESAFAAVIEPYAGVPFVRSVRRMNLEDNEDDALQAVAIAITTTNGREDLCFADGRPQQVRRAGDLEVAAEYAYYSRDDQGLRQVAITGGTLFASPEIRIEVARPERRGRIVDVDYSENTIWIDDVWPADDREQFLEVITRPRESSHAWQTGYTVKSIRAEDGRTAITFLRGADLYRSRILSVNEAESQVTAALPLPDGCGDFRRGWTATDESRAHRWRVADVAGTTFTLDGGEVRASDFAPENVLRLWEFGIGDEVRQSTELNLRRIAPDEFEVACNVSATVSFRGGPVREISPGDAVTLPPIC